MATDHQIRAFRYAETLTLGVYRVTSAWPRHLAGELAGSLRLMTPAISDSILDGCSWTGSSALSAWKTAIRLLERLADALDRADRLGLLDPESTLELLQAQSGAMMEVLLLVDGSENPSPAVRSEAGSPVHGAEELRLAA